MFKYIVSINFFLTYLENDVKETKHLIIKTSCMVESLAQYHCTHKQYKQNIPRMKTINIYYHVKDNKARIVIFPFFTRTQVPKDLKFNKVLNMVDKAAVKH